MKKIKNSLLIAAIILSVLGLSNNVLAVTCHRTLTDTFEASSEAGCVTTLILEVFTGANNSTKIFLWALGIGAILAFGVITYAGVMMSLSGLSEDKSHAKDYIRGAVEGLVLLAVAYVVLYIINPNLVSL